MVENMVEIDSRISSSVDPEIAVKSVESVESPTPASDHRIPAKDHPIPIQLRVLAEASTAVGSVMALVADKPAVAALFGTFGALFFTVQEGSRLIEAVKTVARRPKK